MAMDIQGLSRVWWLHYLAKLVSCALSEGTFCQLFWLSYLNTRLSLEVQLELLQFNINYNLMRFRSFIVRLFDNNLWLLGFSIYRLVSYTSTWVRGFDVWASHSQRWVFDSFFKSNDYRFAQIDLRLSWGLPWCFSTCIKKWKSHFRHVFGTIFKMVLIDIDHRIHRSQMAYWWDFCVGIACKTVRWRIALINFLKTRGWLYVIWIS